MYQRIFISLNLQGIPLSTLSGHEKAYAIEHNESNYHEDVYALVQQRFAKYPNVHLVRGAVPDVLTTLDNIQSVSYLSIDMNNAPAERAAVEYFWTKMSKGAICVLDDYAFGKKYEPQRVVLDEFARDNGFTILTLATGQGMFIKI